MTVWLNCSAVIKNLSEKIDNIKSAGIGVH